MVADELLVQESSIPTSSTLFPPSMNNKVRDTLLVEVEGAPWPGWLRWTVQDGILLPWA